jgi:hypothetical protein
VNSITRVFRLQQSGLLAAVTICIVQKLLATLRVSVKRQMASDNAADKLLAAQIRISVLFLKYVSVPCS